MENNLVLLSKQEADSRRERVQHIMREKGIDAIIACDNANLLYLTGRVYAGFAYIPAEGDIVWLIRRPVGLTGNGVTYIHRPEEIPAALAQAQAQLPDKIGMECDLITFNQIKRFSNAFKGIEIIDATNVMREARSVKTEWEIEQMRLSGYRHEAVYRKIPGLYRTGMTDYELQIEIEHLSRLEGCLGLCRISGQSMEIFMGSIVCGRNADEPSPYDFTMGGRGMSPALPCGVCGEEIASGTTVMVDVNGTYTSYMTDMSRTFAVGRLPQSALDAHECSREICRMFEQNAVPGVEAKSLYMAAIEIVEKRGLQDYFMGHRQHAGFIGHGVGIEINEMPVIAPRSKNILEANNTIALEPKFVIPQVGAVGIENTYLITGSGAVSLTNAPEEILSLR